MVSVCSIVFFVALCISITTSRGCTKLPASVAFRGTFYFQYVHGRDFIKRICPSGTRYSEAHCGCIRASSASWISARRSKLLPSLLSVLRTHTPSGFSKLTSKNEDDEISRRFDFGRLTRSRISKLLYGRPSYDDNGEDDDFEDKRIREREDDDSDDDDERDLSFNRLDSAGSVRSKISQIPYGKPSYDDDDSDDKYERERGDDDDERGFPFNRFGSAGSVRSKPSYDDDDSDDKYERERGDDDDERGFSFNRFDSAGSVRSKISQILYGRPFYGDDDSDDKYEREREDDDGDDDDERVLSPNKFDIRGSIRSKISQTLFGRPSYGNDDSEDKNERESKREDNDDDDEKRALSFSRFDIGKSIRSKISQILHGRPFYDSDDSDDKHERGDNDDDDKKRALSSNRFDMRESIRSKISQILNGRPFYHDDGSKDEYERESEKEDDDDNDGKNHGFSLNRFDIGRSSRSRINHILFGRPSHDNGHFSDKYENEREKKDDDDERSRLYSFTRKSSGTVNRDNGREHREKDNGDYSTRITIKKDDYLDEDDKDETERDSRFDDDVRTSSIRMNKEISGTGLRRGDSPFTGESSGNDDNEDDRVNKDYTTHSPGFSTKLLMTNGKNYRFEDLLDNELDDDNKILFDFGGIFEKKFYGLFEYIDDIFDDVFDDDFEDFYRDLFDDDGYDDIFAPKYAHYFKDSDDDIEDKYKDFEEFFENYSKLSSMYGKEQSNEDSAEYDNDTTGDNKRADDYGDDKGDDKKSDDYGDDKKDDKRRDGYDDGKEEASESVNKSGLWGGGSGFDIHRNGYGDDHDDDDGEQDKRLFDFTSTLKSDTKSAKSSESISDIDSILERFYDNK